jgi:hypothetical protein
MNSFNIFFENSAFWIIPALALAAFFAFLLYRHATTFSDNLKRLLGILRFVLLGILLILLISPVIRQIINHYEKPVLVIAVDNSTSLTAVEDSAQIINRVLSLSSAIDEEYIIEYRTLSEKIERPDNIAFTSLTTDLNSLFTGISNDYENRNLAAVVLLSDGLFNQGLNPVYSQYAYPIYSLGLGDTTTYSDIGIYQLRYNKLSYQGNKIPIQVELSHEGFPGETANVSINQNGRAIAEKNVKITEPKGIHTEVFLIEAKEKGMQRYEVVVKSPGEEKNTSNNRRSAFIDIVEGKKNILLIAPYPHPDIKALESTVTENENYEFIQYIPVIDRQNANHLLNQPVDLVIFHQLPNQRMMNDPVWKRFSDADIPKWWITGTEINFSIFNQFNKTVNINQVGRQKDNVTAWFNNNFNAFNLSEDIKSIFNTLPPVSVPFGTYEPTPAATIFLYQQVGSVQTQKILFATSSTDDIREGVFAGEGLWKWRLYEYAQYQSHDRFNELIGKTIQFLSTREDKRKFRFYPVKNEFSEEEKIIFESEIYNELYKPVYNRQIDINISNSEGETRSYQYVTSENNTRYALGGLPAGIYTYKARTVLNNTPMQITGEFAVNKLELENINLTADFNFLKELSNNSGGRFYTAQQNEELASALNSNEYKDRIQSTEDFLPLINIHWVGILLLLLISIEWITRKYHGAY